MEIKIQIDLFHKTSTSRYCDENSPNRMLSPITAEDGTISCTKVPAEEESSQHGIVDDDSADISAIPLKENYEPLSTIENIAIEVDIADPGVEVSEGEASGQGTKRFIENRKEVEVDDHHLTKKRKLDIEFEEKIARITAQSSVNPTEELRNILSKLHELRLNNSIISSTLSSSSVTAHKRLLFDVKIGDDPVLLAKEICNNEEMCNALELLINNKI